MTREYDISMTLGRLHKHSKSTKAKYRTKSPRSEKHSSKKSASRYASIPSRTKEEKEKQKRKI